MADQLPGLEGPGHVFICRIDPDGDAYRAIRRRLGDVPPARPGALLAGRWAVAGTPTDAPYPCLCTRSPRGCSPVWCPCAGRVDLAHVPARCCGHTVRPHHAAAALRDDRAQTRRNPRGWA